MAETVVVNASPLICLSRAGLSDLLRQEAESVMVPAAVAREILARGPADVTAGLLAKSPCLVQIDDPEVPPSILGWDLGRGESTVLAWALAHPGMRAVIDDLHGRRCAEALGISLRGTVGLVLRARRARMIASARDAFERLRAGGMYLSDRIVLDVLREVGEQ
jgi:predicted nucleic acid-binding protein